MVNRINTFHTAFMPILFTLLAIGQGVKGLRLGVYVKVVGQGSSQRLLLNINRKDKVNCYECKN